MPDSGIGTTARLRDCSGAGQFTQAGNVSAQGFRTLGCSAQQQAYSRFKGLGILAVFDLMGGSGAPKKELCRREHGNLFRIARGALPGHWYGGSSCFCLVLLRGWECRDH